MSVSVNTQLTSPIGYNVDRMVFQKPKPGQIPGSTVSYLRIPIQTVNPDGTIGDLIINTEEVFSFGVSENKDFNNKEKINGHSLPLCLYNRDGPTENEIAFVDTFNNIVENCKTYIMKNKQELGQDDDMTRKELRKLNPLYFKKDENKKPIPGTCPTLYPKLLESKKLGKIVSLFFDENGQQLDPLKYMKKYCYVKAALKIESIFVGSKISFQVKLYEATLRLADNGMKSLLPRPTSNRKLTNAVSSDPLGLEETTNGFDNLNMDDYSEEKDSLPIEDANDELSDGGSIPDDPVDDPVDEPDEVPKKKVVRRVVRKRVVKKQEQV
jgi:hypothetical protein